MDIADVDVDATDQVPGNEAFDKSISSAKTYEARDHTGRIGSYNPSVGSEASMFGQPLSHGSS